ncbi:DUF932 domain-containing protein [Candidatus Aerophobetes bacterium]|nr:DUF932 domain-containing protein [Candidatus Aerophobetes bacterium]
MKDMGLERFGVEKEIVYPRVEERNVFVDGIGAVDGYKAIVNADTGYVYDIASKVYTIVRHEEVVDAVKAALAEYRIEPKTFDVVLSGKHGARLFVKTLWEERVVSGDDIRLGMVVTNSYDRSMGIGASGFGLRLGCSNEMVFGKEIAFEYTMHTKNVKDRVAEIIPKVLDKLERVVEVIELSMNELVSLADVAKLIRALGLGKKMRERLFGLIAKYVDPETAKLLRQEIVAIEEAERAEVLARLERLQEYEAPRWQTYNAFTELLTHHAGRNDAYTVYSWQKRVANELLAPVAVKI